MKTALHLKVDKDIKDRAKQIAESIGIPLSTIMNALLLKFVKNGSVTFSEQPYELNEKTQRILLEIDEDVKQGKNLSKTLHNEEELKEYLGL